MSVDGKTLRDGIFALYTRRFGSVAEFMIRRLIQCGKGKSIFHDLYDDAKQHRIVPPSVSWTLGRE